MGVAFNSPWSVATFNLENGASNQQLSNLLQTVGEECIYFIQEFTRGPTSFYVNDKQHSVYVHGAAKKRLAFIVPTVFANSTLLTHTTDDCFYCIEFQIIVCINVHVRRCSLELFEQQLQRIAAHVRGYKGKTVIIAGTGTQLVVTHILPIQAHTMALRVATQLYLCTLLPRLT